MWDKKSIDQKTSDFMDRIAKAPKRLGGPGPIAVSSDSEEKVQNPKIGDIVHLGPWVLKIKSINLKTVILKRLPKRNPNKIGG